MEINDDFKNIKDINFKQGGGEGIQRWYGKSFTENPDTTTETILKQEMPDIKGVIRGAIGIDFFGGIALESLDTTHSYHVFALERIIKALGLDDIETKNTTAYEIGIKGAKEGLIIIEFDDENVMVHLPEYISNEQYEELKKFVNQKKELNFFIYHEEKTYENMNSVEFLTFTESIVAKNNKIK